MIVLSVLTVVAAVATLVVMQIQMSRHEQKLVKAEVRRKP